MFEFLEKINPFKKKEAKVQPDVKQEKKEPIKRKKKHKVKRGKSAIRILKKIPVKKELSEKDVIENEKKIRMSRSNRKDITLIGLRRDIKTYKFFSNLKIREFFPIHKLPRGKAFIGCNLKNMGLKKISNRWVKVKNVSLSVFLKELMDIREKHKKLQNENRKESKLKTVVNKICRNM